MSDATTEMQGGEPDKKLPPRLEAAVRELYAAMRALDRVALVDTQHGFSLLCVEEHPNARWAPCAWSDED